MAERKPCKDESCEWCMGYEQARRDYVKQLASKEKRINELEAEKDLRHQLSEINYYKKQIADLKAEIEDLEGGEVVSKKKYDDLKAKIAKTLNATCACGCPCCATVRKALKGV